MASKTKAIKSSQNVACLQAAINKLRAWCDKNDLHLNLEKCAVFTINKGRRVINADYGLGDHIFNRVAEHRGLGVIIDS